jgi:hypothetical protein
MGRHEPYFATFDEKVRRGVPWWWLSIDRCRVCGQWWLVAAEERHNDVFYLGRMTDEQATAAVEAGCWPSDFDRYDSLFALWTRIGPRSPLEDPTEN